MDPFFFFFFLRECFLTDEIHLYKRHAKHKVWTWRDDDDDDDADAQFFLVHYRSELDAECSYSLV